MASMTKEELKSAIINHGLSPPPSSAKKEEFVEMYNEQVAPVADDAGEFSSDDEVSLSPTKRSSQKSRTSAKSPRVSKAGGVSVDTTLEMTETSVAEVNGDVDVDTLDDEQLFQLLKENGVDVGPIVDSTRPFYKKKLVAILSGESGVLNGTSNGGAEYSDVDTEEEGDQPAPVVTPKEKSSTRGKASSSSQKSTRSSTRVSQKSPTVGSPLAVTPAPSESGIRKRLTIGDNSDASLLRNTPTPRRSIHSYKVTETTRQTVVTDSSGERRDVTRTVERVESKDAVDSTTASSRAASLKKMLLLVIFLAIIGALVYYFAMGPGTESVKNIMDSVRKIEVSSGGAAAPPAAPAAVNEPPAAPKAA